MHRVSAIAALLLSLQCVAAESDFEKIVAHNDAIFDKLKTFVEANPKLIIRGVLQGHWEWATRHIRKPKDKWLTRSQLKEILAILERAILEEKYRDNPSFAAIIKELNEWNFKHTPIDPP